MSRFDMIAFDADDTLWQNESLYGAAQAGFQQLLSQYHSREWIESRLYQTEMRNLEHFGYGIKAFALSMIETAVELTEGRIIGSDVQRIIDLARVMLTADVDLLDGVADTLRILAERYPLMVITKGDLRDQESKVVRSGLAELFTAVEIVSDKTVAGYTTVLRRHGIEPARFVMVGNSLRSDILPVLQLGGQAVHIPHTLTWAHEAAEPPEAGSVGFHALTSIVELPSLLAQLERLPVE